VRTLQRSGVVAVIAVMAFSVGCAAPSPGGSSLRTTMATPAPCGPSWSSVSSPNVGTGDNELVATSSTSSTDVWAVGYSKDDAGVAHTLVEHWDGGAWSVIPSPDVADVSNYLNAVNALSPTDAWAVGYSQDQTGFVWGTASTLIEHWDGISWSIVPSPNQGEDRDNFLQGVKILAPSDAWAVGWYGFAGGSTTAMHWDGAAWSLVTTPNPGPAFLYAVDGTSSTDLWAVGYYFDSSLGFNQPLFAHWDGAAWTTYDDGSIVSYIALGVVAISSQDVWAVGTTDNLGDPGGFFTQHWDGTEWSDQYGIPTDHDRSEEFKSAAALSTGDVWMAGWYIDSNTGAARTTVEHWDGTPNSFLTETNPPNIGEGDTKLAGITAVPATAELWAVGSYTDLDTGTLRTLAIQDCPIQVGEMGFFPGRASVNPGAKVGWTIPSGASTHRIVDGTGLGLYDSGLKDPPASFLASLLASGTYAVVDQGTGSTMTLKVPAEAFPRTGSVSTTFRITWATHKVRADRVFDVQIRRPGSTTWEDWETGVRGAGDRFVPDGGPGTYSFRARLRNTRTGAAADYSPAVSIRVT
jgi:hypothetical protein